MGREYSAGVLRCALLRGGAAAVLVAGAVLLPVIVVNAIVKGEIARKGTRR